MTRLYRIRLFHCDLSTSRGVGHKGRLLPYRRAWKVLSWLKRRTGLDGYLAPVLVNKKRP